MAIEREISLRVNQESMPSLENFPYVDIDQYYMTPSISEFPEVNGVEWRIRKKMQADGNVRWTSAVKFGDKSKGQRTEIETNLEPGSFFTDEVEIRSRAFAVLRKRRYDLGEELIVDRFIAATEGEKYQGEKEFTTDDEAKAWQPPAWLRRDSSLPSNRKRAIDLIPSDREAQPPESLSRSELLQALRATTSEGPMIITVSGMTGSGKSTIARDLAEGMDAVHLEADHLQIGNREMLRRYGEINHDLVDVYDYRLAGSLALLLASGNPTEFPEYDYSISERSDRIITHQPTTSRNVVIDGLYACTSMDASDTLGLRDNVDIKHILVSTPLYVSVIRRLLRDSDLGVGRSSERPVALTSEETLAYLLSTAIPTYLQAKLDKKFDYVVH